MPAKFTGHYACCPASKKRIENYPAKRAGRKNGRLNKLLGKRRKVWTGISSDWNLPNTSFVSTTRIEAIAADSLQNFERSWFSWNGAVLVTHWIEYFVVPMKRCNSPLCYRAVRFKLLLEEVML